MQEGAVISAVLIPLLLLGGFFVLMILALVWQRKGLTTQQEAMSTVEESLQLSRRSVDLGERSVELGERSIELGEQVHALGEESLKVQREILQVLQRLLAAQSASSDNKSLGDRQPSSDNIQLVGGRGNSV